MARRENDRYLTPGWATATLIERAPEIYGETLLDPCCGDGRMALALASRFRLIRVNDLDPASLAKTSALLLEQGDCLYQPSGAARDATDPALYDPPPDWLVTNPPFSHAGRIAWTALQHVEVGVALLLRITWLEPCKGREWLTRFPPTRMIVMPRIDFVGAGSVDSATCCWLIWQRETYPRGPWRKRGGGIEVTAGDAGQLGLDLGGEGG